MHIISEEEAKNSNVAEDPLRKKKVSCFDVLAVGTHPAAVCRHHPRAWGLSTV